jgi:tetratricopeptide (TPR) repeat protein
MAVFARRNDEAAIPREATVAVASRLCRLRAVFVPMLALLAVAGMTRPAAAQGANHSGGNGGDAIRCSSGKPEIAIIACTHIIEDRSEGVENRAIALRNRAFRHQQLGDFDAAIADFSLAIGLDAKMIAAYIDRGAAYVGKSDWDLAIADFTSAIALDPNQYAAYLDRGQALGAKRQREQAIADFTHAIRMRPEAAAAYRQRAFWR